MFNSLCFVIQNSVCMFFPSLDWFPSCVFVVIIPQINNDYSPNQQPVEIRRSCVCQEGPNAMNRFGNAAIYSIRPAFSLSPAPFLCVREEFETVRWALKNERCRELVL